MPNPAFSIGDFNFLINTRNRPPEINLDYPRSCGLSCVIKVLFYEDVDIFNTHSCKCPSFKDISGPKGYL